MGKSRTIFFLQIIFLAVPLSAQIATKTGTIYGEIVDEKGTPLPGVGVTLESRIPTQSAIASAGGSFRFANLPPGTYSASFVLEG